VPASEIIHDRFNCLFHPLVGVSPIYANGLAATQGLRMQENSANLFANGARPGGILVAPGKIDPENASRLKEYWDTNFAGRNTGKVSVLGDGLKFENLAMNAVDAQLIEQLKWTAEVVCSTFHVPPYKIGVGEPPKYNNIQALNVEYYSQCLQVLFESIELCLDEALGIGQGVKVNGTEYGTEFDVDNLMRMDALTQMDVLEKSKGKLTVNEQRARLEHEPVDGGDTVYLQEQDHSLEWLSRRDAMPVEAPAAPEPEPANDDKPTEAQRAVNKAALRQMVRERANV
jgi:HK97 family phage portal protein